MALALTVDSLDSIPEPLRAAYVADGDKFKLDVDGIEDTTNLKSALKKERERADTNEKKAKAWAALGKTPDEIDEMLAAERTKAEQLAIKAGKFDEVLAKKLGDQKLEYDGKLTAAEKQRQSALKIAEQAVVNTSLATALTKAKASEEGLRALPRLIGDRVKIEFDEEGNASSSILDIDGKPMVGSQSNGLANYDDLVAEVKKTYPSLFEGTGAGGGGTSPRQGGKPGDKTIKRADFDALGPMEKAATVKTHRIVD